MIHHAPWRWMRTCLGLGAPVDRTTYAVTGVALAVVKYAVEAAVLWRYAGRLLSPLEFVSPSFAVRSRVLEGTPEWLPWTLFLWSMPFIWIALSMSVRRAAAAGVSPWIGAMVLLPVVNLVVMAVLACLPDRAAAAPTAARAASSSLEDASVLRAVIAALAVGLATFLVGVYAFKTYGAVLFFGTPLVMGMVAGFLANRPTVRSSAATARIGTLVMFFAGGVLLAFAFEGLICLVMAAPIVMPLSVAGSLLGKWIAEATPTGPAHAVPVILALPLLAGAESLTHAPVEFEVLTVVDVAAPPEIVWRHVVAFPDLPEPEEWFFRCGIACPIRARIEGSGVGAVRHCEFSTGDFVEPITVWEEPRRLAFDVADQPDPMVELSPWRHVHPPHLEHRALASRRGEFRLVPTADGRTRLEGRTWYTFDMHPRGYWTLWSDLSIHAIHRRVLEHIRRLAERDAARADS